MFRAVAEEALALASVTLFLAMVAVWAALDLQITKLPNYRLANCLKIKRASGFFRTQDARAALPQNCSIGNVKPLGESENGTRVQNYSTKVPAANCKLESSKANSTAGFYSENTINPGSAPVEKGESGIAVGVPVF